MKIYYVYVLKIERTDEVLYIGKGHGNRLNHHLSFIKNHDYPTKKINHHLFYKCKQLLNLGETVVVKKISENLLESDALELEEHLIAFYGIDNLCNFSPSGSLNTPPKGTKTYDEYIKKMSEISLKRWSDSIYKEKMGIIRKRQGEIQRGANHPMFGKTHSDEARQKISKRFTGVPRSREGIEKTRQKLLGREILWKDKIGATNKKTWKLKIENGYKISEKTKEKISNSSKGKIDKILDISITERIIELYELYGPNRIQERLKSEGIEVSLYIIRRELKKTTKYKKYRKNSKL
jgi:hypothetical protein